MKYWNNGMLEPRILNLLKASEGDELARPVAQVRRPAPAGRVNVGTEDSELALASEGDELDEPPR